METSLQFPLRVGLIEAFTALEETFHDLCDEQPWAFLVPGQNNMAWIIMHCLQNLDDYANDAAAGKRVLVIEDGPTLTHGEMRYGAGVMAARKPQLS